MKQTTTKENHHHYNTQHHWHIGGFRFWDGLFSQLFILLVGILFVTMLINLTENAVTKHEDIYRVCAEKCTVNKLNQYDRADNLQSQTFRLYKDSSSLILHKPLIQEYDRTQCLENCNKLYLKMYKQ